MMNVKYLTYKVTKNKENTSMFMKKYNRNF